MKALKYTILSILLGGAVSSCNFLDKEPGKLVIDNYFNTPEEANSFLTGVYAALGQSTFYGADYLYLVGVMSWNTMEVPTVHRTQPD